MYYYTEGTWRTIYSYFRLICTVKKHYQQLMRNLREAIRQKYRIYERKKALIFGQKQFINGGGATHYSVDLVYCDYFQN